MPIYFHIEPPVKEQLEQKDSLKKWLSEVAQNEGKQLTNLNFILCTDDYLHELNLNYLQHDTLTDVITFDYTEDDFSIEGDIFISMERINDNAQTYAITPLQELYRVMVHGVLHLLGYKDKSEKEKREMRDKENFYLKKISI